MAEAAHPEAPPPVPHGRSTTELLAIGGLTADRVFGALGAAAAGGLVLALLVVAASIGALALPSVSYAGSSFFTSSLWDPAHGRFGALSFVYGTIVTSLLALVLAAPIALAVAAFLSDLGPTRLRRPVSALVELLAAVPSVVYGLWAALVLAPLLRTTVEPALEQSIGGALFRGPPLGVGLLCASLVLAVMVLPTIAQVSREVLRAVPAELREGGLALGATRWDVFRLIVLPHARRGLAGATLLGFARAASETMAVAAVVGSRAEIAGSILAPGYTMSSVIANEFPNASNDIHIAALAEIGVALFVVTLAFNVGARVLVARPRGARRGREGARARVFEAP